MVNAFDAPRRYQFHDVRLNPHIKHARHAIALDEFRDPFAPTLWAEPEPGPNGVAGPDVKQVWFPGNHSDVGGGHQQKGLSDGALKWMIDEASAAVGLVVDTSVDEIRPDPLDDLHEDTHSTNGPLAPVAEAVLQPRPRAVPLVDSRARTSAVHTSAYDRQNSPRLPVPYRPTRRLAPGETATVAVAARERWNATGLYLEADAEYHFAAEGQWQSAWSKADPVGGRTGSLRPRAIGRFMGRAEKLVRRLSHNPKADLIGARREEDLPWMSLVGAVANERTDAEGHLVRHERIDIGAGTDHRVARSGYLYAFANDAWGFYWNNTGSVRLRVTRSA